MAAQTEVHGLLVQVFNLHFRVEGSAFQIVADGEAEVEGVHGVVFGGAFQGEGDGRIFLCGDSEGSGGSEAVDGQLISLALIGVATLGQTGHIGEDVGSTVAPVGAVALPQVFGAVCAANGHQFCAGGGNAHLQAGILDGVKHE